MKRVRRLLRRASSALCWLTAVGTMLVVGADLEAQDARARVRLPGFSQVIALDSLTVRLNVRATPAELFTVAAAVLEHEMKIDITTRDSLAGVVR